MLVQPYKLRRLMIGLQLAVGIMLLTASYITSDQNWTNELLTKTFHSKQQAENSALTNLKTDACS